MRVFTLPDWPLLNAQDCLSPLEYSWGAQRIEQHEWRYPRRGDWSARLEESMADANEPVVLIAQGLGCVLLAWWAVHSQHAQKVKAALLINPWDVAQLPLAEFMLSGWAPVTCQRLPFPTLLIQQKGGSEHCTMERTTEFCKAWGARSIELDGLNFQDIANHDEWSWWQKHAQLLL